MVQDSYRGITNLTEAYLQYHFTRDHLWLHIENGTLTIGLTEFGISQLGDVIYFDPMPQGQSLAAGEIFASIEGENGRRALFTPLAGEILETNQDANAAPDTIAEFAYTDGWLVKFKLDEKPDLTQYLASSDYETFIEN